MREYLKENLVEICALLISLISLMTSFFFNRKRLNVVIEDDLDNINDIYFDFLQFTNKQVPLNFGDGKVCYIKVVNPSPSDIYFFDLRVIDLKTNKPLFFLTDAVLELTKTSGQKLFYTPDGALSKLNIPSSTYGTFPSNSFTRFEIAFYPTPETTEILISFKVAISSLIPNKEAGHRKNFKYYKKIFTIDESKLKV